MRAGRKFYNLIAAVVLIVAIIFALYSGVGISYAATTRYSDVLQDLQQDSAFNIKDYPADNNDKKLKLIQVAESTDGELLIYVYLPCVRTYDLRASSINISRYADNAPETSFKNYRLEFCNSYGTLYKYKVIGFDIQKTTQRVYNVSNILRPFDKLIDEKPGNDNTVSEIPNAVGQCWTATTENGNVTYSMTYSDVIEIKNKYVGYVDYNDGVNIGWTVTKGATSAHFVAFSTDKPMDKLKSASLTFNERQVTCKECTNFHLFHKYGDRYEFIYGKTTAHEPNPLTLHYTQKASNQGGGNIKPGIKYTWDRIQTTQEYLSDKTESGITFTKEGTGGFDNTQWVLNFYETSVTKEAPLISGIGSNNDLDVKYTEISDVMILELEFEYQGITYKLGAVDNKQSGSQKPIGSNEDQDKTPGFWERVLQWLKSFWWVIPVGVLGLVIVSLLIKRLCKNTGANNSTANRSETTRAKAPRGKNGSRGKKK